MGNTYRRNKRTGKPERDGYRAAISAGCEHNNWCPWCRRNRTINRLRTESFSRSMMEEADNPYWPEESFSDDPCFPLIDSGHWRDYYLDNDIYNWEDAEYAEYVNGKYS